MTPAELQPGHLYRLTREIENPVCDKRSSNPLKKCPVFVKGKLFMCFAPEDNPRLRRLHSTLIGITGHNSCPGFTAAIYREKGRVALSRYDYDRQWTEALVPLLEEQPINTWELMREAYGWTAQTRVLCELIEDGTVSLERVIDLMHKHTPNTSPHD